MVFLISKLTYLCLSQFVNASIYLPNDSKISKIKSMSVLKNIGYFY